MIVGGRGPRSTRRRRRGQRGWYNHYRCQSSSIRSSMSPHLHISISPYLRTENVTFSRKAELINAYMPRSAWIRPHFKVQPTGTTFTNNAWFRPAVQRLRGISSKAKAEKLEIESVRFHDTTKFLLNVSSAVCPIGYRNVYLMSYSPRGFVQGSLCFRLTK